ncbi:MAG: helix-turn-helix domain-containing protein [Acutalibacteraceae bacterium]
MYVDYKQVGRRIAKRRKELGLKQAEVTEMAELSDKYLSNIERATSVLSIDVLMKLCHALKATPDDFLLGTTKQDEKSCYDDYLIRKISSLSKKETELVLSFIDWLSQQNI